MGPKYERRDLAARFDDCGRMHDGASSEAGSWNFSTLVDHPHPDKPSVVDACKDEPSHKPEPVHFSDWLRTYRGGFKSPDMDSPPASRRDTTCLQEWNKTTAIAWRNTYKREQFHHILDGRRLPRVSGLRYRNVKPQYLKPRKRYGGQPPLPDKKRKRFRPLVFPPALPCSCDKSDPEPAPRPLPVAIAAVCFCPLCVGCSDAPYCCWNFSRSPEPADSDNDAEFVSRHPLKLKRKDPRPHASASPKGRRSPETRRSPRRTRARPHTAPGSRLPSTAASSNGEGRAPVESLGTISPLSLDDDSKASGNKSNQGTTSGGASPDLESAPVSRRSAESLRAVGRVLRAQDLAKALRSRLLPSFCGGACGMGFSLSACFGENPEADDE